MLGHRNLQHRASSGPSRPQRVLAHRHRASRTRLNVLAAGSSSQAGPAAGKWAVIIGGGWGGFGAALSLLKAGLQVVVLDAATSPGGLASTSVINGRTVEPGIKGFWAQYTNIYALLEEELGLREQDVFTPWTSSSFYSPQGLQVTSPIFGQQPRLPAPLGSFFYTQPLFTNLSLTDRLTAFPLVKPLLEYSLDWETYQQYDRMSAHELFRSAGVSAGLYRDFLDPILQAVLFAPATQLSAAAALDALNYFALAHQQDFDVRWCKGPVGEVLLKPLAKRIGELGGVVLGGRRVTSVVADDSGRPCRVMVKAADGAEEAWEADALVFAVGVGAMQRIVSASPALAENPQCAGLMGLKTIDVLAIRMWLDSRITPRTPSNVLAGFDTGVGGTFFDLNTLQDMYRDEAGSVVEVDFYGASSLLPLTDEQLLRRVQQRYLATADPAYASARITDSCIQRFRGAVTAFSPGCASLMPDTCMQLPGTFLAGDWVKQGPGSHGAKGLCQEKALATGLKAGNEAARYLGATPRVVVREPEPDEAHIVAAREAVKAARGAARLLLPDLPLPKLLSQL